MKSSLKFKLEINLERFEEVKLLLSEPDIINNQTKCSIDIFLLFWCCGCAIEYIINIVRSHPGT